MNKRQKEIYSLSLEDEKTLLKQLEQNYINALADIKVKIKKLQKMPNTQSRAYQIDFQKHLEAQIQSCIDILHSNNFETVNDYLNLCYENGFVGNMYELQGYGVAVTSPINQREVVSATKKTADGLKLSTKLKGTSKILKSEVVREIQRGISSAMSYDDIARNISSRGKVNLNRAMRIARTEGHRVQNEAIMDSVGRAVKAGVDCVKRWNAVLDGRTRTSHQAMDGKWVELDEKFSNGLRYPGDPNGSAAEVVNCRCRLETLPRWEVEGNYPRLRRDNETGEIIECRDYAEFRAKYLSSTERVDKINWDRVASSTDREQFTRYSRVLKGIAPNDLDAFCKMKYNNTDEWNKLKKQYRVVNQYKIDSGNVSPKQILELDSKIITEKRNNFTSRYKSSGNIAGAFVDDKKDNIVISHSRIGTTTEMNKYKGNYTIVGLADNRQFNYIDVMLSDGSTRTGTYNDSEAKLFEYLAREYQTSQFKTITLLSERGMCDSCIGVMKQFEEQYGVKINAVSNKKVEGNVWKYRGKKK